MLIKFTWVFVRCQVTEQLPIIVSNMQNEIVESMKPILFENIINVLKLLPSINTYSQTNECCKFQVVPPQLKVQKSASSFQHQQFPIGPSKVSDTSLMVQTSVQPNVAVVTAGSSLIQASGTIFSHH